MPLKNQSPNANLMHDIALVVRPSHKIIISTTVATIFLGTLRY